MKFAKTAALIMSLSIAGAALCACNNQPEPVSSDINVIATQSQNSGLATVESGYIDPNAGDSNYKFTYKGVDFVINSVLDVSGLVEGSDYEVSDPYAYCAGQGEAYDYFIKDKSIVVSTLPNEGKDIVNEIRLKDDTVSTPEGICIGSTVDQVKAAYGEPTESVNNVMRYIKGSSVLTFEVDLSNGTVTAIEYTSSNVD